jgi:transcriptional regulator with XRE-family HTH domain
MIDFRLASSIQIQAEIGARLRHRRLMRSWTQRDVATRAGVALNAVKSLESGGNATVASLVKVLQVLSLIDDLSEAFKPSATLSIADLERLEAPQRQRARSRKA